MNFERKIEVEFKTTVTDFQRILVWYHWKRLFLEFSLMVIVGIPFCYFLGFNLLQNGWAAIAFISTILILSVLKFYGLVFRRAEALKQITQPAKTIFSDQGLETITKSIHTNRAWESYAKIFETDKDFIFFQIENAFAAIPKRFFKNQDDIEVLRELVNRKLGEKAKLQN